MADTPALLGPRAEKLALLSPRGSQNKFREERFYWFVVSEALAHCGEEGMAEPIMVGRHG